MSFCCAAIILTERLEKVSNTLGPSPKASAIRDRLGCSGIVDRTAQVAHLGQVVCGRNFGTPLPDLHGNIKGIVTSSRFRESFPHSAHIEAPARHSYGRSLWIFPKRGEIAPSCDSARIAIGESSRRDRREDRRHGRNHGAVRRRIRTERKDSRSSGARTTFCAAVAEVSFDPWTAPRQADPTVANAISEAERMKDK